MKKVWLAGLVVVVAFALSIAVAEAQSEEKIVLGQVERVDESGTELTLTDGTTLLTPPGAMLRPGVLEKGTLVLAMYREMENGNKILTRLARGQSQSVPSEPSEAPSRF
jgi:hypothetical protein